MLPASSISVRIPRFPMPCRPENGCSGSRSRILTLRLIRASYLSILLACPIRLPHSPVVPGLMLMNSAGFCAWLRPCRGYLCFRLRHRSYHLFHYSFSADGFDASSQQELDAYVASVLDEKYRQLSLGLGWIDLKNDLIPTPSTISLPPEVSNKFSEVAHLFENYPPLLMVFEEAIQELIDAAKGDERKFAIIAKRWIGDATLDGLGNQFGITRERLRQLEVELREDFNRSRNFYDAVLAKIERFPQLMDRAKPFNTTYGKLFTAI